MPDKLQIEITAAVSQALAGLQQAADAVAKLKATTVKANAETAASHSVLGAAVANSILAFRTAPSAGAFMKDLGVISAGVAASIGTGLKGALTSAGAAIKTHLVDGVKNALSSLNNLDQTLMNVAGSIVKSFGPLIGITAVAGIGIMLEQAIAKTIQWDDAIAKLSHELNGNVTEASKWVAVANFVGIDAGQLAVAFQRLSVAIITQRADLKEMGIAVVDSNGHLRQMTDIIADLQRWFRAHKDSIAATNEAIALFGRGNASMAALLGMTADQMRVLTAEATALGEIIGAEQLAKWRAMDAEVKTAGFSIQALSLALGHGFMPVIAVVAQAIAEFVARNLNALVQGLAHAAGFIVGLMSALFGITFKFTDFANAISGVSNRVAELGTAYDLTGNAAQNSAGATRNATDAINDQIDALREQNQLFQDQIDKQIALLEAEGQQEAYQRQQEQAKQRLLKDQKNIDKLRSDYNNALLLGDLNLAQSIYDQLVDAQQQMANDQKAADDQVADHDRQAKIDALRDTQKLHSDETNDLIKHLEKRAQAIQRAMAASNSALLVGSASTAKSFNDQWNSAGKTFADGMNAASVAAGAEMGKNIKAAMDYIMVLLDPSNDPKKVAARKAAWQRIGDDIADAFVGAFERGLIRHMMEQRDAFRKGILEALFGKETGDFLASTIPKGYAAGGTVPGFEGAPTLIIAHGGERVVTVNQQRQEAARASQGRGPVTMTAIFHIGSNGDDSKTARIVRAEISSMLGLT